MTKIEKTERIQEIKELVQAFCNRHLNEELTGYALKLCDKLGRKRTLSIVRGRKEIWSAAIVYVIARLNFLFDMEKEFFLTADTICDFFGAKKSTVGNKATQIERACKLGLGAEGFCSPHISDSLTFVQTPDGFIFPKSMLAEPEILVEFVDAEGAEELERFMVERLHRKEHEAPEKKARCRETNLKIAEKKKKKKKEHDKQLGLFDEF